MYELIDKIIKVLVVKRNNPEINYTYFMDQLSSYFESNRDQLEVRNVEDFRLSAIPVLKRMESEGTCTINYDTSRIVSFQVHKYYRQLIMKYYKDLEERPDLPFPDLKSFSFNIDSNWIVPLSIKNNFMEGLGGQDESDKGKVMLIEFQEGISDIVIPPEIIQTAFFDNVLKKAHLYIQNQNNYAYIGRYLRKACQGNELAVKNMMESMLSGPPNFRAHIKKPEDFAFRFFSFMCNKVMKDMEDKNDKTAADIYTFQAMAMLRVFITDGRAKVQKDAQKRTDYRDLTGKVKKPPLVYTISDLYEIKDIKGQPYSAKYSRDFIHDFIKNETAPKEDQDLPYLVRVAAEKNKDYYIQRDMMPQVFLKTLLSAGKEIRDRYFKEWEEQLLKFRKNKEMDSDAAFISSIENLVKSEYKLLSALLNPGLIYLANKSNSVNSQIKMSVDSCFRDPGKFKTIDILLGIERQDLLKQVRASLPLSYSIPFIGKFLAFVAAVFTGKKRTSSRDNSEGSAVENVYQELPSSSAGRRTGGAAASTGASENFRNAIVTLKKRYLKSEKDLNLTLDELAEKWNPLFDKQAREDLVEDINSLIRDFMRSKKKLMLKFPPDEKRISTLTDDLINKTSKVGIKKQDYFRRYVELYIIKLLENIKSL